MRGIEPVIDTHAHLDELEDPDDAILEAKEAGVSAIIAVGQSMESNKKTLEIAGLYRGYIYPAIGYHPWLIKEEDIKDTLVQLDRDLKKCVALGEIGLDYKAKVKKKVQKRVFQQLLELAGKHDKPVIIHSRYSHQTTYDMVKERGLKKAVFHWYSGPLDVLDSIVSAGYYVSATPALLYNPYHGKAMAAAPLSNILIETDTPVTYQELRARPKHVRITLRELARVKGLSEEEVARETTANAKRLYGLELT
jgi:TatD DNase family protein